MNTQVSHLKDNAGNLVGIKVKTSKETFIVPVLDVRRNEDARRRANAFIRAGNIQRGSKFMKISYSGYGYRYN